MEIYDRFRQIGFDVYIIKNLATILEDYVPTQLQGRRTMRVNGNVKMGGKNMDIYSSAWFLDFIYQKGLNEGNFY